MSWDDVLAGGGSGGKYLRLSNDGDSVVVHFLTDNPKSVLQVYNQAIKKGAVVSQDFQGGQTRLRHAFEVFDLKEKACKILMVSSETAKSLKNVFDTYNGWGDCDVKITRQGSGLKTKYMTLPIKRAFKDEDLEGVERIDLDTEPNLTEDDEKGAQVIAGTDPDLSFPPEETPTDPETPEPGEALAEVTGGDEAPPPPPKKTAIAAPAKPAAAVDPRTALIRKVAHAFATKPKFKAEKERLAAYKKAGIKKPTYTQASLDELKKLVAVVG